MKWIGYQFFSTCSIGTHSWGLSKFVARKAYLTTRLWNIFINVQLYYVLRHLFYWNSSLGAFIVARKAYLTTLLWSLFINVQLYMFNWNFYFYIYIYIYIYMYLFFAFLLDNVWLLLLRTYSHKEINNSRNY